MQLRSVFLALLLAGCPPVDGTTAAQGVTFLDGTFEPSWLSGRNGETVTLTYRPMTAEGPVEPNALRLDERLSWSEPRPLGDGRYAIDVSGADVESFAPIGLVGCDLDDAACVASGSIRGHLRFAGEPTAELRALRPEQSLAVGEARPWWVFAVDAEGEPSRAAVAFESSDPSIFTVDGAVLTGISAGEATLMATADGLSMAWPVTVQATPMGPPIEELLLLSEQRVNFEEVAAGTGRLATLDDTPTVVFHLDGRDSPTVVATWTGTGFGYEVLQQTPHDVAQEAHLRVNSDGRLFAAYRSTFPQGIAVASRASPPGSEWSYTQLAIREDPTDVDSYPGELSDLLVDREDRVWVVTLTRSDAVLSAEDCVTTLRLHELAAAGFQGEEDILVEGCDVAVAGETKTLHLMPDPQADRPMVLLDHASANLFNGSLHVYREDGGWWPEYWLGYNSGYFPNSNLRRQEARPHPRRRPVGGWARHGPLELLVSRRSP